MNQIWFGLVWISPKESKPQRNKKTKNPKRKKEAKKNKKMISRLVWTCLDPSSPQNTVFFVFFVFLFYFG